MVHMDRSTSAYVDTLLILLRREVTIEIWASTSGSPSLAAACRPTFRDELCDRIERVLYA